MPAGAFYLDDVFGALETFDGNFPNACACRAFEDSGIFFVYISFLSVRHDSSRNISLTFDHLQTESLFIIGSSRMIATAKHLLQLPLQNSQQHIVVRMYR